MLLTLIIAKLRLVHSTVVCVHMYTIQYVLHDIYPLNFTLCRSVLNCATRLLMMISVLIILDSTVRMILIIII